MLAQESIPVANTLFSYAVLASSRSVSTTVPLFAASFIAKDTQLSSISVYILGASGSPVASVYIVPTDGSTGATSAPNTSPTATALASVANVALVAGVSTISGFGAHTLTVGAEYWIVFKYISGTSFSPGFMAAGTITGLSPTKTTVYNGIRWESAGTVEPVTWATNGTFNPLGFWGFVYTSGKSASFPCSYIGAGNGTAKIYHTSASSWLGVGQRYILSLTQWANVTGFVISLRKATVSVAGSLYVDAYINGAKVATSNSVPPSLTSTTVGAVVFDFPRNIAVPPGASITFIVSSTEDLTDDAADYTYDYTLTFTDSASVRANLPFGGRMWRVIWDGATNTFTESTTTISQAAVLLDANVPFPPAPLNRRKYHNQR